MSTFDATVEKQAQATNRSVVKDLLARAGTEAAVVASAPAGAGKSGLVVEAVGAARKKHLRVAVATPTNEQAYGLVRRLATAWPGETVTFVPSQAASLPDETAELDNVDQQPAKDAAGADLVVATLSKLGDAHGRGTLGGFDVLVLDEAYQADSSRYFAAAGVAPTHLLVGDRGQLLPFSTIDDPTRWRGLPEDPLRSAISVLLTNHPSTAHHSLPITRRLDARAVPVVRSFYPGMAFGAWVRDGVRRLELARSSHRDRTDQALDLAAASGWAHVELPGAPVLVADDETIEVIAGLVDRLMVRRPRVRCEREPKPARLAASRVAVAVSHREQRDYVRLALDARGYPEVVVDTANRLQGLEFDVVVAWHPLAGLAEVDEFHLEAGRLCVMLTRHRHACIVVGRASDRELLCGPPPPTPAWLGVQGDTVLEGWDAHHSVFEALAKHRVAS
jgi:hypothetical protein